MTEFKPGDRIKVEYEATYQSHDRTVPGGHYVKDKDHVGIGWWVPPHASIALLAPAEPPEGSVVIDRDGWPHKRMRRNDDVLQWRTFNGGFVSWLTLIDRNDGEALHVVYTPGGAS